MQLQQMAEIIIENIDVVLDEFDLEMNKTGYRLEGACPLHSGDNKTAFNIYLDKDRFYCYTHQCHITIYNSMIGLVRLLLSVRKLGWSKKGDRVYPFNKTLNFIKQLYDIRGDIVMNIVDKDKQSFFQACSNIIEKPNRIIMSRQQYLTFNRDISNYFINRGFKEETLKKFDVFSCNDPVQPFFQRSMIPTYDEKQRQVLGISARSELDKEPRYHYTLKFPSLINLYGLWYAKENIQKCRSVILTESPTKVWRLYEAGFKNVVGIWGAGGFNDHKRLLLDGLGVSKLILALDNNEAGIEGSQKIRNQYNRYYNIVEIKLPEGVEEISDLNVDQCREVFNGC